MFFQRHLILLAACFLSCGCNHWRTGTYHEGLETDAVWAEATRIDYPQELFEADFSILPPEPRTLNSEPPTDFRALSLDEAITIALENSEVIRDLGGRILSAPEGIASVYDPAIRESDPLFGVEAALSAFDTRYTSRLFFSQNDRGTNNVLTSGGARELVQDLGDFQAELSKVTALGSRFSIRNLTQFDSSNQTGNLFPSAWDSQYELAATQPLLQGAGAQFNRIAGPNGQPGFNFSNGVLIARINTDVSLADFEASIRDFLSEVEDAYWDLYFAYRDLDAKIAARDSSLKTWQRIYAAAESNLAGGEAYQEAQAREQYFQFQQSVQDSLSGSPTGANSLGVYQGERRLRRMLGMQATDDAFLRPSDEPSQAEVHFSWDSALNEALTNRVELRRQAWQIEKRELELLATKNFTLPRLDAVALYRWRGFGDDLTGNSANRFGSSYKDLFSGDHQEWQLGLELNIPIGYRQAWAGVRNAELKLARERAVFRELERQISHDLSDAIAEATRARHAFETNEQRLEAAVDRRDATQAAFSADKVSLDLLLDAQRTLADAQSAYFQSIVVYAKATKNVHAQKGTLLPFNGVNIHEGSWPEKAYADAARIGRRWQPAKVDFRIMKPGAVSMHTLEEVALEDYESILPLTEPEGDFVPTELPPQPTKDEPAAESPAANDSTK